MRRRSVVDPTRERYDADNDPYLDNQNLDTEGPLLKNNEDLPII